MTDRQKIQNMETDNSYEFEEKEFQYRSEYCDETPELLLQRYRIVRKLGQGAQAQVYEAERLTDGQKVAIKALRIDSISAWKEYELFQREANVLKSLQMDGVASFVEAIECLDEDKPRAYIVQEFIEGRSLAQMMASGFRLDLRQIFQLTIDLVELLEKLHHHDPQIIHRDIKPSNIMLKPAENGRYIPYLIDFGAVANPQVQSGGSTVAGTYGYMPPEQLMGRPTPASDIYALAATLVYLISGTEPGEMQISDFRLIIEPHLEAVPRAVSETLRLMLDPNPQTRLCDYRKIQDIFRAFLNNDFMGTISNVNFSVNDAQMEQVHELCQPGNLDIWAALPDAIPREISSPYQKYLESIWDPKKKLSVKMESEGFVSFSISAFIIFIPCFLLLIIIDAFFIQYSDYSTLDRSMCVILFAIVSLIYIVVIYCNVKNNRIKKEKNSYPMKNLLRFGKKTVATIVKVEFQPLESSFIEKYNLKTKDGTYEEQNYYGGFPCFKVQYRFNPLEDDNPDDLVHEVTINYDPQKKLSPGTPLPILYFIDLKNHKQVTSMPYPLPLDKVVKLGEETT